MANVATELQRGSVDVSRSSHGGTPAIPGPGRSALGPSLQSCGELEESLGEASLSGELERGTFKVNAKRNSRRSAIYSAIYRNKTVRCVYIQCIRLRSI